MQVITVINNNIRLYNYRPNVSEISNNIFPRGWGNIHSTDRLREIKQSINQSLDVYIGA